LSHYPDFSDCQDMQAIVDKGLDCGVPITDFAISEREALLRYDKFLDAIYPIVKVGPCTVLASKVMKDYDPIAHRCGFSDWLSSEEYSVVELDHYFNPVAVEAIYYEIVEILEARELGGDTNGHSSET